MLGPPTGPPAGPADPWAELRWLATPDSRMLAAILLLAVLFGIGGAIVGWRARAQTRG